MRLLLPALVLLMGCDREAPTPTDFDQLPPDQQQAAREMRDRTADRPTAPDEAVAYARRAAQETGRGLKKRLQAAMSSGGPAEAVTACNTRAPGVAADVLEQRGVRVGRSSLRLRNIKNANTPGWVQEWLTAQGERPFDGVVGIAAMAETDGGPVARVLIPIGVEPVCVACHGPTDALAPDTAARIAALYPDDNATGYNSGDLRGALWAEYPVLPTAQ